MYKTALAIVLLLSTTALSGANSQCSDDAQESSHDILWYLADLPSPAIPTTTLPLKKRKVITASTAVQQSPVPAPQALQRSSSEHDVDSQETTISASHSLEHSRLAQRYAQWPYLCQPSASQLEEWHREGREDAAENSNLDTEISAESSHQDAQRETYGSLSSLLYDNPVVEPDYGMAYLEKVLSIFVRKGDLTEEEKTECLEYCTKNILPNISYAKYVEVIRQLSAADEALWFINFQEQAVFEFLMERGPLVVKNIICSSKYCLACKEAKEIISMFLDNAPHTCKCPHCTSCIDHKKLRQTAHLSFDTPSDRHTKKYEVYGEGW